MEAPGNSDVHVSMASWESGSRGEVGGTESLTATPSRDCDAQAVHPLWCGEEQFTPRGFPGKAYKLPMVWPQR